MVRHHQPRKGSVAFSPRKRVAKETPRIKAWPSNEEPKLLGLAGYKAGMTHAMVADNLDEELSRKITLPKDYDQSEAIAKIQDALAKTEDVRVLVHTNPKMASVPKKKPEIFECALGGSSAEEKLNYALDLLGKEVRASDIFNEGQYVDAIATTKGKGVQGVVKRWNIRIQYGKAMRSGKGEN